MRINLTRRSNKSELIDGIVFPSGLSSRCRETDTLDSAHAPTKLCTNYSTCAFLHVAHRSLQCRLIARSLRR